MTERKSCGGAPLACAKRNQFFVDLWSLLAQLVLPQRWHKFTPLLHGGPADSKEPTQLAHVVVEQFNHFRCTHSDKC